MKKVLNIVVIIAVCFGIGYGVGLLIGSVMNNAKDHKGFIGKSEVELPESVLTPEAMLTMGRLSDPQLSADGSKILYGVAYASIEKNRICRNLYVCNVDGSNAHRITTSPGSINNARWSTDGKTIYFLQGGQMYKAPLGPKGLGKKQKISDVSRGISEFCLSPDQTKVLYTSTIPGPVQQPSNIDAKLDKAQAYITDDLMYRHWDHWVTETPRSFVCDFSDGKVTDKKSVDILGDAPYELPAEPFGGIEQLSWSPDSRYIAYSCRKLTGKQYAFSTNSCIFIYDTVLGTEIPVTVSGGYDTDPAWSPSGDKLAWLSMPRDGYEADRMRLMVCDVNLAEMKVENIRELAPSLDADASGIFWSDDSQTIIFPAMVQSIMALWEVDIKSSSLKRLTDPSWLYNFSTPFGVTETESGRQILSSYQSMSMPSELTAILPGKGLKQITNVNTDVLGRISDIEEDYITIVTPQKENLYCWVLYPPHFDSQKQYTVIEMFNGGPQTAMDQSWSYRWNFFLMAQQGNVVILPCRHGDSGLGQAWKEQISGDYQGLNMQDYLLAASWARSQSWCKSLAGVGASYGGFSVYNIMGLHGDLFDCFIAHAGIFNEKMLWYSTEEAWFGNWDNGGLMEYSYTPGEIGPRGDGITFGGLQQAGAPYADVAKTRAHYAHDPESKVTKWHTPLLCIHGMMDFRIPYEQGMAAFNAAQMMGVPSRLVIFPEETHWVLQPQNALLWQKEFFGWIDKWCK